jgi:N-acetyl-anhydromuramyl-L-alanine amidase AmpD
MSLFIDRGGFVDAERIKKKIFPFIERGSLDVVNGIVVHQTNSPTAQGAFNSYAQNRPDGSAPNGAHFLIDKDGQIYQTASLFRVTNHVGSLQSRCIITQKCSPAELKNASTLEKIRGNNARAKAIHANEKAKRFPDRYPMNEDAIGIEIVGIATGLQDHEIFEPVNDKQNASLKWLIKELAETFNVSMHEVYRHPEVGRKNGSEASTAKW